jgi:hypothetical protein
MVQKGERGSRRKRANMTDLEEYPKPPEEHAYELRMEKLLKRMLEEQEKKAKKNLS